MKKIINLMIFGSLLLLGSCNNNSSTESTSTSADVPAAGGQEAVQDDVSQKDVVKVAVGSPDHTTLVAALKQAELVTSLANSGPFTVFAPTDAAFGKLPAGTVDGLMKEDKKADLQNILQYHVTTSALDIKFLKDGMNLGMVNGDNLTISVKDGKTILNGSATIVGSVRASNGWVHVIDGVLLPPAKK